MLHCYPVWTESNLLTAQRFHTCIIKWNPERSSSYFMLITTADMFLMESRHFGKGYSDSFAPDLMKNTDMNMRLRE